MCARIPSFMYRVLARYFCELNRKVCFEISFQRYVRYVKTQLVIISFRKQVNVRYKLYSVLNSFN